jgi:hypothetical protein
MASTATISYLNFITRELNRYIPLPLLVLGTIGNILNILVFTRPTLRTNPCSLYFVSSSIVNFISLYIGLITPFLALYGLDPTQKNSALCKIRYYLRFTAITLSTWFILFACLDRFLSTSAHANLRSWSSLRLAKRIIPIASIIAFLFPYTQVFYCYTTYQKTFCTNVNNICKLSNDITLLVLNSGFPPILMVILSILTIRNVKSLHRINLHQRRDVALTRILLIQVIILVLFAVPITSQKIYGAATMFNTKSSLTTAVDSLFNQITTELSYINSSTAFYIYSLTSKKFRKEVSQILAPLLFCQRHKTNCVQPITRNAKSNTIKIDYPQNPTHISIH